jgi:hypothetical protein
MFTKSLWLPLSAVCLNSGSTESKLLRASAKEIPPERILENIATVCLSVEQCQSKFLTLDTGGYFYSGNFPSKGCYTKNNNVWFGTGGTYEEMAETDLPGILTRVWCDVEVETLTFAITPNQATNTRTERPTPQPTTQAPIESLPAPSQPPTPSPTIPPIELGCLPDRFDNEQMDLADPTINFNKLYPGQFICSKPYSENQYRFGVTESGNVVWTDTAAQERETKVLFENTESHTDIYFSLRVDATMVVTDDTTGTVLWESAPVDLKHPMSHYPRCLSDHDCPYFHLHSDGVLVMNYIADDGAGWQATQLFRVYDV